jgi:hypothetical protein
VHCVERAVPVQVDVDLGSAVVAYRPVAGEERSSPAQRISPTELFHAAPWRTFRWYFGQRHFSGTYWSSTQHDHVIYESRLELATLLLADFDPIVRRIVAQPFMLRADVDGQSRKHIPDYLWGTSDGPVVVDVVRAERLAHPEIELLCAWTRQIVESLGWSYRICTEPPPVELANVRFLAGYRREWLANQDILHEIRSCAGNLVGMTIADAEQLFGDRPWPLVRPALMHLLWCHELGVDLSRSLLHGCSTIEAQR